VLVADRLGQPASLCVRVPGVLPVAGCAAAGCGRGGAPRCR
jgi:hypothetical protein